MQMYGKIAHGTYFLRDSDNAGRKIEWHFSSFSCEVAVCLSVCACERQLCRTLVHLFVMSACKNKMVTPYKRLRSQGYEKKKKKKRPTVAASLMLHVCLVADSIQR